MVFGTPGFPVCLSSDGNSKERGQIYSFIGRLAYSSFFPQPNCDNRWLSVPSGSDPRPAVGDLFA
jgi:hypothetical protein